MRHGGVRRDHWYPPVASFDYAMPIDQALFQACCFQPEELCL
jgi:hypothetical protein